MPTNDLPAQAKVFADDLSDLLNGTVTNGPRLTVLFPRGKNTANIGYRTSRRSAMSELIPIGVSGPPRVWLSLVFTVSLDGDGDFLMITQSAMGLFTAPTREDDALIVSVDYARHPGNKYPGSHLHVGGHRDDLDVLYGGDARKARKLRDLHLPVGGKRFRPTLEDLVEFMVLEEMVEPRDGWEAKVKEHRDIWELRQTKAAVRNHQAAAAEVLRSKGWKVEPPAAD